MGLYCGCCASASLQMFVCNALCLQLCEGRPVLQRLLGPECAFWFESLAPNVFPSRDDESDDDDDAENCGNGGRAAKLAAQRKLQSAVLTAFSSCSVETLALLLDFTEAHKFMLCLLRYGLHCLTIADGVAAVLLHGCTRALQSFDAAASVPCRFAVLLPSNSLQRNDALMPLRVS